MSDDELNREVDRMLTPELARALQRTKDRRNAGITSTLEAVAETIEVLLSAEPTLLVPPVVEAFNQFKAGDETALRDLLEAAKLHRRRVQ